MDNCGLCKLNRPLRDSHLLPKALYGRLRNAYPESRLVVSDVDKKSLYYSDKQISARFLCEDCEGDLNRFGENHVIRECLENVSNFRLREKISRAKEIEKIGRELINARKIQGFEYEMYLYFAASIFWRASAWPQYIDGYNGALGSKYQEQFRLYLRKSQEFPNNAYLIIYVDSGVKPAPIMMPPVVLSKKGCYQHEFFIPGLRFHLYLGSIAGEIERISKIEDTKIFISECDFIKDRHFLDLFSVIQREYTARGKLAKNRERLKKAN